MFVSNLLSIIVFFGSIVWISRHKVILRLAFSALNDIVHFSHSFVLHGFVFISEHGFSLMLRNCVVTIGQRAFWVSSHIDELDIDVLSNAWLANQMPAFLDVLQSVHVE